MEVHVITLEHGEQVYTNVTHVYPIAAGDGIAVRQEGWETMLIVPISSWYAVAR